MKSPVIQAHQLKKTYVLDGVQVDALRGVDLAVNEGEFVAIMGPSGSGKSTLMNILGCLDKSDSGTYRLQGNDVATLSPDKVAEVRNREIGFVFQNFNLLPRTSALENVETPLVYADIGRKLRKQRATEALERVGLGNRMANRPNQLSGGQQQRVAIARALVNRPTLMLADEPTGNLDSATSEEIMQVLTDLNRDDGMTLVLITHERSVAEHADRIVTVRDGLLYEEAA